MINLRKIAISLYGEINKILQRLGRKLEYIGGQRYLWIKNMGIKNILDVGASRGQSIERRSGLLGNEINFNCFEPLKNPFEIITKNYGNQKNVKIHNFALGNEDNSENMFVSNVDDSSSLLQPTQIMSDTYEQINFEKKEEIQIRKLDSIFKDLDIDGNILMKVDTQGFEGKVFEGARESLKKISLIVVELSFEEFYKDQPLFDDILKQLNEYGFRYYGSFEQSANPSDGKPLQQDAFFVNINL